MKFGIKIFVAILVLVIAGFAVWTFFFREKDEVRAYNSTSQLVDYKESLAITNRLDDLRALNYVGSEDAKTVITGINDTNKEILKKRQVMLDTTPITGTFDGNVVYIYDSYLNCDKYMDTIILYYLPYLNGSNVNRNSLKELTTAVNNYTSALKSFSDNINLLVAAQGQLTSAQMDMEVLKSHYNTLYLKYRAALNSQSKVIIAITNYIRLSKYGNDLKASVLTSFYDSYAYAIKYATVVELIQEIDYSNDAYTIKNNLTKHIANTNIFTTISEYQFLTAYNELNKNYNSTFDLVFAKKFLDKKNMASGTQLSEIKEDAKAPLVTFLKVMGF